MDQGLNVEVGALSLESPLLLGSGYITETPEFYRRSRGFGCAGMVTRSLKDVVDPSRARIPAPRYAVPDLSTMLNCEWGNENPWTMWRDQWLREARSMGGHAVISLSGRDPAMCARMIDAFEPHEPSAYEINVSCSHSGALHGNLNVDIEHVSRLMAMVRPRTRRPIWIKLSYSTLLIAMAIAAERGGADAIVCTNSIGPGLLINPETGKPLLGTKQGVGGVTGSAILPIALRCVYDLYANLRIPVVGVGGVYTAGDVCQMLMAGARAVQLYTGPALQGPRMFLAIERGLVDYLKRHKDVPSLGHLVGAAHRFNKEHCFEAPPPAVLEEKCTGCGACIPSCAFDAMSFERREGRKARVLVVTEKCVGCNACIAACPPELGALQVTYA